MSNTKKEKQGSNVKFPLPNGRVAGTLALDPLNSSNFGMMS